MRTVESFIRVAVWATLLLAAQTGCSPTHLVPTNDAPIMMASRYVTITHDIPYVLRTCRGNGWLRYVGVRHTRNAEHDSVRAILDELRNVKPDVVFVEGPVFDPAASLPASVSAFGEPGAALYLARERGVAIRSLDAPFQEEAALTRSHFGPDKAAAFYGLRIVAQEARNEPSTDIELLVRHRVVPWLVKNNLIDSSQDGVSSFRDSIRRAFGRDLSWRDADASWFNPLHDSGEFTTEIARFLVLMRDQRFAKELVNYVRRGMKVVAVAGATHVVMQEPAILSRLGCKSNDTAERLLSPSEHRCDTSCQLSAG
jgi:hypothetical protein